MQSRVVMKRELHLLWRTPGVQDLLRVVESDGGRAGGEDGAVLQAGTDDEEEEEEEVEEEDEDEAEEDEEDQQEGSEGDLELEAGTAAGGRGKADGDALEVRTYGVREVSPKLSKVGVWLSKPVHFCFRDLVMLPYCMPHDLYMLDPFAAALQASTSESEGDGADDEAMFRTDPALAAVLRASADAKTASKEVRGLLVLLEHAGSLTCLGFT